MTSSPQPSTGVDAHVTPSVQAADDDAPPTGPQGTPSVAEVDEEAGVGGEAGVDGGREAETDVAPAVRDWPERETRTPAPASPQERVRSAVRRTGKVRKARLRLLRVEPWSVMKSAFVLSIAIGITFVVAVATLWSIVDAAGVFEIVGDLATELTESEASSGLDVTDYVGFSRVVGLATVIAVVDVVLLTALATLFAFLYNLSASLLGGFEITLAEDD